MNEVRYQYYFSEYKVTQSTTPIKLICNNNNNKNKNNIQPNAYIRASWKD